MVSRTSTTLKLLTFDLMIQAGEAAGMDANPFVLEDHPSELKAMTNLVKTSVDCGIRELEVMQQTNPSLSVSQAAELVRVKLGIVS